MSKKTPEDELAHALKAAREFLSELSLYNNLVLPARVFGRARNIIALIGRVENGHQRQEAAKVVQSAYNYNAPAAEIVEAIRQRVRYAAKPVENLGKAVAASFSVQQSVYAGRPLAYALEELRVLEGRPRETRVCKAGTCTRPLGHDGLHSQFDGPPADDCLAEAAHRYGCCRCASKVDLLIRVTTVVRAYCPTCAKR
ncbi:MAG: hypothetical protein ACRDGM_14730 [bacterium]